jgi:hypothetical protein
VFDPIINSPGSRKISGLLLQEPGQQLAASWLQTSKHSLTASSNCGLPLQIIVCPGSSCPVPPVTRRLSLPPGFSSWLCPVHSSEYVLDVIARYDGTAGARIASSVGLYLPLKMNDLIWVLTHHVNLSDGLGVLCYPHQYCLCFDEHHSQRFAPFVLSV